MNVTKCPTCKKMPKTRIEPIMEDGGPILSNMYAIWCRSCEHVVFENNKELAIRLWNNRKFM